MHDICLDVRFGIWDICMVKFKLTDLFVLGADHIPILDRVDQSAWAQLGLLEPG